MENAKNNTAPAKKSSFQAIFVVVVILFAMLGYITAFHYINDNIVQYHPPVNDFDVVVSLKKESEGHSQKTKNWSKKEKEHSLDSLVISVQKLPGTGKTGTKAKDTITAPIKAHLSKNEPRLREYIFHKNPSFLTWFILVLVMIAIAAGCFPAYISQVLALRKEYRLGKWKVLAGVLPVVLLALFLLISFDHLRGLNRPEDLINRFGILFKQGSVLINIVNATFVLITPLLFYMFLIAFASETIEVGSTRQKDLEDSAWRLESLGRQLQNTLMVLTAIVIFSVFTSSTLRHSIKAELGFDDKVFDLFPEQASHVYGLYFSLFLGIMYIPVYLFLKTRANLVRNAAHQAIQENPAHHDWASRIISRMDFDISIRNNAKIAVLMLSPLITTTLQSGLPGIFG